MDGLTAYFLGEGFDASETEQILACFHERRFERGEYFLREGQIARELAYVASGFFQFYTNIDGEEKTSYTAGDRSFIASLLSYLKEEPAKENIRAVADSVVYMIRKNDVFQLRQTIPTFAEYYIDLLEGQICCIDESRLDGLMLSASARYEKMLQKEPELLQKIPVQFLASILGVTPRHLSRIRNSVRR